MWMMGDIRVLVHMSDMEEKKQLKSDSFKTAAELWGCSGDQRSPFFVKLLKKC